MRVLREAQTGGGPDCRVLNQRTGQWEPYPARRHAPVEPDPRFAGVRPAIKQAAPRAYKRHPAVPGSMLASQLARLRQAKQGQAMQTAQQYQSGHACATPQASGAPSSASGRVWHGHTVRGADAVATAAGRAARRAADAVNMSGASGRAAAAEPGAPAAAAALGQHPADLAAEEPDAPAAAAALGQHSAGLAAAGGASLGVEEGTSQDAMHELGRGLRRRVRTKRFHRQVLVVQRSITVSLETGLFDCAD